MEFSHRLEMETLAEVWDNSQLMQKQKLHISCFFKLVLCFPQNKCFSTHKIRSLLKDTQIY